MIIDQYLGDGENAAQSYLNGATDDGGDAGQGVRIKQSDNLAEVLELHHSDAALRTGDDFLFA